ncbi:hypothetical protein Tcan_12363 [Toxocara canis]|uniref:Uncharacterized protein n=1 Tax=Toxocara canis TaxID=6265 RepID=A0A0B2VVV0_TOXCA|nr:hypothetical protein Tcan_12363 [Toxocara canis]
MALIVALFVLQLLFVSSYSLTKRQLGPSVQLEKFLIQDTINKLVEANHRAKCALKNLGKRQLGPSVRLNDLLKAVAISVNDEDC